MECAIALSNALVAHGARSVEEAFRVYDAARRTEVQITQHNADVSLAWFEHMERSSDMKPMQFAMAWMCRAKSITDNLPCAMLAVTRSTTSGIRPISRDGD
jgi:anthraniloyl-CoA monooxygenase